MTPFRLLSTVVAFLLLVPPVQGQVIETTPTPVRTDESVTITFYADRGNQALMDCDCEVYAHTGLITSESADDSDWQYVMDEWPENRELTKLTEVAENTYELTIPDIRDYYSQNRTGAGEVPPRSQEEIRQLAFVFRNADGTTVGKTQGGGDIFADVNDVAESEPFVGANILSPQSNPPLYPFMTASDTTVTVSVTADVANVEAITDFDLVVDGDTVASGATDRLTYDLTMDTPNRFRIEAIATADTSGGTLSDTTETLAIRTPDVVNKDRPAGIEPGINYDPNDASTVTLSLAAPKKKFAYVIGDFTNWEIDDDYFMYRDEEADGTVHWWVTIDGLSPGTEYDFQYFVDGQIRTADPFSHKVRTPQDDGISADIFPNLKPYPDDQTDNIVSVMQPGQQQSFQFEDFEPPPREELVVYELLMRDFVEQSSFKVMQDTLSYLDSLGVNAVELMPVANFGGNNSWGYNPNFHLALDKSYGTPEGFRNFVREAHRRDIAVIMDVVYNHVTDQSPFLQLYGSAEASPFLESGDDRGICGVFFRELNQGHPLIKDYIDRANRYWIEKFNVDGFRFDLAKCVADNGISINDSGHSSAVVSGWKDVSDYVWDNVDPDTYMILEFFGAPNQENELGGYRDEDTGSMMTWHNMNRPYSQADMGYVNQSDFSSDLSASYFGARSDYDQPSFIAYMESHDEQWLMRRKKEFGNETAGYSTRTLDTALNRQKLVGAFYFTIPGPRMMWQFGELGYGWGEDECLKDGGDEGPCAASAPGRTAPKPIRWDYYDADESPERVKLFKAWSALLDLRSQHEVFTSTNTTVDLKVGQGDYGRSIVLQHDQMDAVVVGNFGLEAREVAVEFPSSGTWYDFYTGTDVMIGSDQTNATLRLGPGEFHIYTSEEVAFPEAGLVPFESAAPAPAAPANLQVETGEDAFTVTWDASTAGDLAGYDLYRGTSADFDTTGQRLAQLSAGTTSYTDSEVQSGTTYYYRVVALDANGERSALSDAGSGLIYPQSFTVDVTYDFGQGTRKQDYRLVAFPGDVSRDLQGTFPGEAGDEWQAYWDDGSISNFLIEFDGSSTFNLEPGRGFWVISDTSWTVNEEVSTVALNQEREATIDLHDGWNIISNPLDRSLDWGQVLQENQLSDRPLWAFNGSFSTETSEFASARTGRAYYFRNATGLDQLTLSYDAGVQSQAAQRKTRADSGPSTVTLRATQEDGEVSSAVQVGWSAEAADGLDALDWVAPPQRFSALSLRSVPTDAQSGRQQVLARDVRPAADGGARIPLRLTAAAEAPVTIRAEGLAEQAGQEVRLLNEATGRAHDLRAKGGVTVDPSGSSTALTLLTGSTAYVESKEDELLTSSLTLHGGSPNPFRSQTTIRYTLPESGPVTLEVFDILGRRVRVLVDERKEQGTHSVRWTGGGRDGRAVASGVYLGRLHFDGKTRTQKIVVVR